jgi:formylmethanofuran dehydrogenase subunit E
MRYVESTNKYVCDDCIDEYYTVCDGCGELFYSDDTCELDGCNYCDDCYNDKLEEMEEEENEEEAV